MIPTPQQQAPVTLKPNKVNSQTVTNKVQEIQIPDPYQPTPSKMQRLSINEHNNHSNQSRNISSNKPRIIANEKVNIINQKKNIRSISPIPTTSLMSVSLADMTSGANSSLDNVSGIVGSEISEFNDSDEFIKHIHGKFYCLFT